MPVIAPEAAEDNPVTEDQLHEAFQASLKGTLAAAQTIRALLARPVVQGLDADFRHRHSITAGMSWLQVLAYSAKGSWDVEADHEAHDLLEEAALLLLARPEFTRVNARGARGTMPGHLEFFPGLADATALHFAAAQGRTRLCLAIAGHEDFVEGNATWSGCPHGANRYTPAALPAGETAADVARRCGFRELSEKIEAVVAYGSQALLPRVLQVEKTRQEPGRWLLRCRMLSGREVAQLTWPDDAAPGDLLKAAIIAAAGQELEEPIAVWNLHLVGIDDLLS